MSDSIVFMNYENKIIQGEISKMEDNHLFFCSFSLHKNINLLYSGEIKNKYIHGKGNLLYEYSFNDGDFEIDNEFSGMFKNGSRDGYGISYYTSNYNVFSGLLEYHGKEYEGYWKK